MKRIFPLLCLTTIGLMPTLLGQTADEGLSLKKVQVSGLIDGYVSQSFQEPASGKIAAAASILIPTRSC